MSIHKNMTLFELTELYPETIDVLVASGFRRMTDPALRERFGSSITVEAAAHARGLEPDELLARFQAVVNGAADGTDAVVGVGPGRSLSSKRTIRVMALVPSPIKVPMTNVLDSFSEKFTAETGITVDYNLQAAYTGTDWMEEDIPDDPSPEEVPEIFLSAGFRLFFTDPRFLSLRKNGAFADRTGWKGLNEFGVANGLADPEGKYSVIGVVPAVFMVNRDLLGDRPVPRTWR